MRLRAAVLILGVSLAACGKSGSSDRKPPPARTRPALPGSDAAVGDAGAADGGPENGRQATGDGRQAMPDAEGRKICAGVFPAGVAGAIGRAAGVRDAESNARRPLPPTCAIDGVGTVMVDCTVRGGLWRTTLGRLTEHGGGVYRPMAAGSVGRQALSGPGQIVFVDVDTDCLVTVTADGLDATQLLALAKLAEAGVTPQSAY